MYGARYVADEMDVKFAKFEWKKITIGFNRLASELSMLDFLPTGPACSTQFYEPFPPVQYFIQFLIFLQIFPFRKIDFASVIFHFA